MRHLLRAAATIAPIICVITGHSFRVQTTSGTVVGHPALNRTSVTEFLGIRYAEAPVGELRFAPPKKYIAPKGSVFEASEWVSNPEKNIVWTRFLIDVVCRLLIEQAAN